MARVTIADVRNLLPNSNLTDEQIQFAIDSATLMVDQIASGCASNLSEDQLAKIELYLTAHLCTPMDQSLSLAEEKFEGSMVKYSSHRFAGTGILSTTYGTMANTLSNGCLTNLDRRKAKLYAVGSGE